MIGALAGSTHAAADIVHFVNGNPVSYNWRWIFGGPTGWLDITRAPDDQPNVQSGSAVAQESFLTSEFWNVTIGGARVATVIVDGWFLTEALQSGDLVNAREFEPATTHIWAEFVNGPFRTTFPMGEIRYIGVLTESGNYGWIAVRRGTSYPGHFSLEALEWAYETIPGKGIRAGQVPTPSGLALFTSLLFVRSSRRRNHAAG